MRTMRFFIQLAFFKFTYIKVLDLAHYSFNKKAIFKHRMFLAYSECWIFKARNKVEMKGKIKIFKTIYFGRCKVLVYNQITMKLTK